LPSRLVAKAICAPLGDQAGSRSAATLFEMFVCALPSGFIV
jgi:hypothetical protein